MPFTVVRNDITNMKVDAIVNTANPRPVIGSGTDSMIHAKAGPKLLAARKKIGDISVGEARVTPAFDLDARYVIHTVGPVWMDGSHGEEEALRRCYENALALASKKWCKSIAFPLISTGNYGFPKDRALQIAISVFSNFLLTHEMQIYLVVFHQQAYRLSEKLFQKVDSYIDQNYVDLWERNAREASRVYRNAPQEESVCCESSMTCFPTAARQESAKPMQKKKAISLADLLKKMDAGFTDRLLELIDQSGEKDSAIYKRANLSKQLFSKIRNNPGYKPTKATALALALALHLDVAQTNDLIGRAGYTLSNSSKFDLIVRYYIEQGIYNVVEINIALYEYDQPLLGG